MCSEVMEALDHMVELSGDTSPFWVISLLRLVGFHVYF